VAPKAKFSFKSSSGLRKQASAPPTADVLAPQSTTGNGTTTLPNSYASSSRAGGTSEQAQDKRWQAETAEGLWGHGEGAVEDTDGHEDVTREKTVDYQDLDWAVHPISITPSQPFSITALRNAHVVLRPTISSDPRGSDSHSSSTTGTLSHLSHTLVDLFGASPSSSDSSQQAHAYTSLTLNNIHNSIIITGPIAGPIHITSVTNSILLVSSARQFRMHRSQDVDVYLYVSSRPIIEDCDGIRFAPLPKGFLEDRGVESKGRGQETEGMWDQVQDFNWLRAEQSPHWSVMRPEERAGVDWRRLREDSGWRDIICGLGS